MTGFFKPSLRWAYILTSFFVIVLIFWPARRMESQNFVFYFPGQHKLVPVQMIGNTAYLPLLPVLNAVGQVSALQEKRGSLRLWFEGYRLRFRVNQSRVQVNKQNTTLPAPVFQLNGQWVVPVSFLSIILPRLSIQPIVFKPGTDRAFVGNVRPVSYVVSLAKEPSGARLTIQFTGKVAVQTASTNGKWILFLSGAPVEPLEQQISFQNSYVKSLDFDDQDGRPKLIISPVEPGLNFIPQLTNGGQTLIVNLLKPPSAPGRAAPLRMPSKPPVTVHPRTPARPATPVAPPPPPSLPAIVLDAAHGGSDSGARSRDGILEKNLAAQMATKVQSALDATKKYRVILTRTGDSDPSFEQRSLIANTSRAVAFLTFHAGELGDRSPVIAVYTYQPGSPSPPLADAPLALFTRWDQAQEPELAKSRQLAVDAQQQLARIPGAIVPPPEQAPVRDLRSIDLPGIAVEVGTLSPDEKAGEITSTSFQQQLAAAIVAAIEQFSPAGASK
ncbi:MAG: N-acetylmuramoyl-L-alanine amidase [Terriglobia bacterium]